MSLGSEPRTACCAHSAEDRAQQHPLSTRRRNDPIDFTRLDFVLSHRKPSLHGRHKQGASAQTEQGPCASPHASGASRSNEWKRGGCGARDHHREPEAYISTSEGQRLRSRAPFRCTMTQPKVTMHAVTLYTHTQDNFVCLSLTSSMLPRLGSCGWSKHHPQCPKRRQVSAILPKVDPRSHEPSTCGLCKLPLLDVHLIPNSMSLFSD